MLRNTPGVTNISSFISRGARFVNLTFDVGTDIQDAKLDVINNLNQAPPQPADASEPRVFAGGGQQSPPAASLLIRVLPHNPDKELASYQKLIEEYVEPRLARIPGVSQVNLAGEQPREMQITRARPKQPGSRSASGGGRFVCPDAQPARDRPRHGDRTTVIAGCIRRAAHVRQVTQRISKMRSLQAQFGQDRRPKRIPDCGSITVKKRKFEMRNPRLLLEFWRIPLTAHFTSSYPQIIARKCHTDRGKSKPKIKVFAKPEQDQIGDNAYDGDPLDDTCQAPGVTMIAPHKCNRKNTKTQDGRAMRRYKRRWKVERLFAWLQNYRRLITRFEYYAENFLAFLKLTAFMILAKKYL